MQILWKNSKASLKGQTADEIGASQRQVERILAELKDRSIVRRVGANRNGYWEVIG